VEGGTRQRSYACPKNSCRLTGASQPFRPQIEGGSDACFRAALRPTLIYPCRCSPARIQREKSSRHFSLLCQPKVRPLPLQSPPQTVVIAIIPGPRKLHQSGQAPSIRVVYMLVLCATVSPWDDNHTSSFGSLQIRMSPPLRLLIAQRVCLAFSLLFNDGCALAPKQ
jgi:hypothetical protein